MKKIILLLILLIGLISNIDAQWTPSNGPYGGEIHSLAINPIDSTVIAGTWAGGIFLSTDNGSNWKYSGLTNCCISSIAVSPDGKSIFAVSPAIVTGIFRSTDNGVSWQSVNNGLTNLYVTSIVISPDGSKIIAGTGFQGNGGGIFLSTNNGLSWIAKNNGLTNNQINSLAISPDGTMIFAATNNGVFLSTDNGSNWTAKNNGLSISLINSLAISPVGSLILAATNIGIFRSTNFGTNWQLKDSVVNTQVNALTFTPDGKKILAGTWYGRGIYLSTDQGINWNRVNNGFTDVDSIPPCVFTFAINPAGNIFFTGTQGLGIYRSDSSTINWTSSNNGLTNLQMEAFAFSPTDANIFSGSVSQGIFYLMTME